MAEQMSPRQSRSGAGEQEPRVNPIALGGVVFAACVMGISGTFNAIAGLAVILNDNFQQAQSDYAFDFNVNVRGWVQMISGVVVFAAALNLFSGRTWARAVGIVVVGLSAVENFFFTPYYPAWSALIIFLDILVIWALVMYGHREAHKAYGAPL
ncbi:Integral membrane protein OS=Streptomyces alboniger OX=132473 GN=CP975_18285 PE=4 SV=1 [Streptomyces alboniger]